MRMETYNSVVKSINSIRKDPQEFLKEISVKNSCSYNSVLAIYTQCVQKKLKRTSYLHNDPQTQCDHWKQYKSQQSTDVEVIYNLAIHLDMPPVMLCKMFIELSKPDKSLTSAHILRNRECIEDPIFRSHISYCLEHDDNFGPNIDLIKKSIGEEYESILKDKLMLMEIPYKDEDVMRNQGYDKTPDFLLTVPVAFGDHVINWIESKASFGDEHNHKQYLREQYWSYWNRFGPGLVIYWFGFIEELSEQTVDKGILVMDHLPGKFKTFQNM